MWRIYNMLELRLIEKNGKCGECAVWCNVTTVFINNDVITFNIAGESNQIHFTEINKVKSIKVVKK